MPLYKLIAPLGMIAYLCLFLAALSGFLIFKYQLRWVKLKAHIYLGIAALILATIHAVIVIFYR